MGSDVRGALATHRAARERAMLDASTPAWKYEGKEWNRYQMMELMVARVSEGEDLVDICSDPALPTLREVRSWYKNHPDFLREMQEALECRGDHVMAKARKAVESVEEKDDVPAAKLKMEFYEREAARLNSEHQNKTVVKKEGELDNLNEDQLKMRLKAIMAAHPGLKTLVNAPDGEVHDAEIVNAPGGEIGMVINDVDTENTSE